MKPTFGSLFAGIGGLDLGLERAGWECRWQVEIDPYCVEVLKKHWPEVKKYGDIRTVTDFEPVDLICGGFPCQPVSVAGRRKGTNDTRWLWPEVSRVIGLVKPRWVLVDNVPGLRTTNGGAAFAEVLQDLARHGYDAEWASIPAAAVGAPHLRYRVFLVAHRQSTKWGVCNPEAGPMVGQSSVSAERKEVTGRSGIGGAYVADSAVFCQRESHDETDALAGCGQARPLLGGGGWWSIEPDVGRVAHGVPARVDRLRALGNAVVPQVAEWVGRRMIEVYGSER